MITTLLPMGSVRFSNEYFVELVGNAAQSCYGVAGMVCSSTTDRIRQMLHGSASYPEKGVKVTAKDNKLLIELHIAIIYGINAATAAKSISHRVKEQVEAATGLKVAQVVVSIDDVIGD